LVCQKSSQNGRSYYYRRSPRSNPAIAHDLQLQLRHAQVALTWLQKLCGLSLDHTLAAALFAAAAVSGQKKSSVSAAASSCGVSSHGGVNEA